MKQSSSGWPPKWFSENYARKNVFKRIHKEMLQLIEKYNENIFFTDDPNGILIIMKNPKIVVVQLLLEHYPFAEPTMRTIPDYKIHRLARWSAQDCIVEYVDTLLEAISETHLNADFLNGNREYKNSNWVIFWSKK